MELFKNSYDAMRYAFSYSTEQYAQTPMSKLMRTSGGRVGSGKGLVGNDGAGQSGMIRERIDDALSALHVAIIVAKFAPTWQPCSCKSPCCSGHKRNPEWEAAIVYLTEHMVTVLAGCVSHRQLRRFLVERYFGADKDPAGRKLTMEAVARKCGVNRDTAAAHNAKITQYLRGTKGVNGVKGEEDRALYEADGALQGAGFIGQVAA